MKILLDMNLSPQWVELLEKNGYKAVHWSDVGDPQATDRQIMEWALNNSYVVMTHDLDFGAILAATKTSGPSVIQLRTQDVLPGTIGMMILKILKEHEAELQSGALIVVDEAKARLRILPLKSERS